MDKKGKNKEKALDKIFRNDIAVYVLFLIILVVCIIIVGKAIGLGMPTF